MKRLFSLVLLLIVLFSVPPSAVQAAPVNPGLSLSITPREVIPAQAGFVFIGGPYPLDISATLGDAPLAVFWSGEGYIAPFVFGFDEPPGEHTLTVDVLDRATGERTTLTDTIRVLPFNYPEEYVALNLRLTPLLDYDLNVAEENRLDEISAPRTPLNGWGWPFTVPAPGRVVTSRFGGHRSYNSGVWRAYHTGVDFRMGIGEPVFATADGVVAAAEFMDVRGNVVEIDHGFGVYSQYAHMSELLVVPGQPVVQGDVVGLTGALGRTNGPHLHFEIIVNGQPVDPLRWLRLDPNFIPPREVRPEEGEDAPAS